MAEDIQVPSLGESITEATIGQWFKKAGDPVQEDEVIVELETDKVALEVTAPVAGVLSEILSAEGETVEVGHVIARVDAGATAQATAKADRQAPTATAEPEKAKETAPPEQRPSSDAAVKPMSPSVRRLIADHDLDPAGITGTGKNGRITKADVMKAVGDGSAKRAAAPAAAPTPVLQAAREERVPMSRMRKRIAERLKEAQNTAAMLTTYNEVDMSAVIASRGKYKELFERKHGIKLGFMSFFVQAAVKALRDVPAVNAEIQGDEIVYKNYYNIGVAVSAPKGLVVPVVKDADRMSFADTEKAIVGFGKRARDGKLGIDDMQGGTFTISNGGVFGSLLSSPILNPPQPGILGMHKIEKRPVVVSDEIVIRPMMYLALSYDHRIIDGREAVTFLVRIKECIEDPERMLLDL